MPNLQVEEGPIDLEIVGELIAATPESWKRAILDVRRRTEPPNIEKFEHEISNPDGLRDLVEPTEKTYEAIFRLADLFKKYGRCWKTVRYSISLADNGNWNYKVKFEYE